MAADSKGFIQAFVGENMRKKEIQAHDDYILKCQLSPNNKFLATCSADKKIKLFKVLVDMNKDSLI